MIAFMIHAQALEPAVVRIARRYNVRIAAWHLRSLLRQCEIGMALRYWKYDPTGCPTDNAIACTFCGDPEVAVFQKDPGQLSPHAVAGIIFHEGLHDFQLGPTLYCIPHRQLEQAGDDQTDPIYACGYAADDAIRTKIECDLNPGDFLLRLRFIRARKVFEEAYQRYISFALCMIGTGQALPISSIPLTPEKEYLRRFRYSLLSQ